MKKLLFIFIMLLSANLIFCQVGSFKIRTDDLIQIGYDNQKALTFGQGIYPTIIDNGVWGMEHWNGGFNIYQAWPGGAYGNYKIYIKDSSNNVGIGKIPWHKLDVNGDIATYGALRLYSDEKLKTNISELSGKESLSKLLMMKSYTYNYKLAELPNNYDGINRDELTENKRKMIEAEEALPKKIDKTKRTGFMAQEVRELFPDLVTEDGDGHLAVDYVSLIPVIIEGMKEQQKTLAQQNEKIRKLETSLSELKNKK